MKPSKIPVISVDPNLLYWMSNMDISENPMSFDRTKEQEAFSKLLSMRAKGEIDIACPREMLREFVVNNQGNQKLLQKVFSFFSKQTEYFFLVGNPTNY